ncbi:MAG: glycosyltransferase family 4 protein [Candidatus Acidiferrales bacterium]
MRKYLFIAANEATNWGGSELLWSSVAEKLVSRGDQVRVSYRDFGKPIREIQLLRSAGCQIFYRDSRLPPFITRQIRRLFPAPDYWLGHVRTVGHGVDLVIISQGSNDDGLVWMEAARAAGYKYAVIAQTAVPHWWPNDDMAGRLAESYKNASAAYFVSQSILDLSRHQFASPLRNAKVVRNPFNVRYDACPPWPGDPGEGLALACVGRLDVNSKGHDLLLQVLSLPHWRERKARVSLFGKGQNERVLRHMAEQLNLTSVKFAGHQNNIEEVWSKNHALVLPSRYEGMPLAVVEAMLCGRPCIATDVGGNRELIRDGINGFLAKAATVELLDEAMNRAWDDRSRLMEMGRAAATDVRRWVSKDPTADFISELANLIDTANEG